MPNVENFNRTVRMLLNYAIQKKLMDESQLQSLEYLTKQGETWRGLEKYKIGEQERLGGIEYERTKETDWRRFFQEAMTVESDYKYLTNIERLLSDRNIYTEEAVAGWKGPGLDEIRKRKQEIVTGLTNVGKQMLPGYNITNENTKYLLSQPPANWQQVITDMATTARQTQEQVVGQTKEWFTNKITQITKIESYIASQGIDDDASFPDIQYRFGGPAVSKFKIQPKTIGEAKERLNTIKSKLIDRKMLSKGEMDFIDRVANLYKLQEEGVPSIETGMFPSEETAAKKTQQLGAYNEEFEYIIRRIKTQTKLTDPAQIESLAFEPLRQRIYSDLIESGMSKEQAMEQATLLISQLRTRRAGIK